MNNLSWFIYLADVFSVLDAFFTITCIIMFMVILIAAFLTFTAFIEGDDLINILKIDATIVGIFTFLFIIAAILPGKSTLYAIAASEMGEQLIKTPTANKAMKALDVWLDKQIADIKEEEK